MDRAALCAFITRQRYGVVSSTGTNGTPQSALVGIASTLRLEIIFDTVKSSRKYPNLLQRPMCSLVIGWSGEQTLQLEGIAEEPQGEALRGFQDVYFAQWPECREHMSWPGIAYFVVHPEWIRYTDYDQKPPLIQEVVKESLAYDFDVWCRDPYLSYELRDPHRLDPSANEPNRASTSSSQNCRYAVFAAPP